uniref:Uncharacterized protein n=1 Tax=Anguilla anguilla TaxID=7936 RepID=A0A0E9VZV5_ANGAN
MLQTKKSIQCSFNRTEWSCMAYIGLLMVSLSCEITVTGLTVHVFS